MKRGRRWVANGVYWLLLITYSLFILFPIFWIILMSLKRPVDIISPIPRFFFNPTFNNYVELFSPTSALGGQGGFLSFVKNSLIVTNGALILTIIIGLPASFSLSRFVFRGKDSLAFTFLSFRFAPELTVILPLYIIFQKLGLYNTHYGLILAYQSITLPLFIWMMRGFFDEIPRELEEATLIDGGSWWDVFRWVALPLVQGGLAATIVLCWIFAWNNFIFGLILGGQNTQPVTVAALSFMSYEEVRWGQMAAASVVIILPQLLLAGLAQRYLVRGLTYGATAEL